MNQEDKTQNEKSLERIEKLEAKLKKQHRILEPFLEFETNPLRNVYDDYIKDKTAATTTTEFFTGTGERLSATGTGTQSITGVGFKPKYIQIDAYLASNNGGFSNGNATSASRYYCFYHYFDGSNWLNASRGAIVFLKNSSGTTVANAYINSLDTSGFTIDWDILSEDTYFIYKCFK